MSKKILIGSRCRPPQSGAAVQIRSLAHEVHTDNFTPTEKAYV